MYFWKIKLYDKNCKKKLYYYLVLSMLDLIYSTNNKVITINLLILILIEIKYNGSK